MAKRLGGKNVGTIEGQDISHPLLSGEVKHRKSFVGNTFMQQCIKNCPSGKTPVVIVHQKFQRFEDSLVLLRLKDFEDLFGKVYLNLKLEGIE